MSNTAILYLRLLRKIVRESAWRLGGSEETFLATGFGQAARDGKERDCILLERESSARS